MGKAQHWWHGLGGTHRTVAAGAFAVWHDGGVICLERGVTLVRSLDPSDETAFAQVRRTPATLGLEALAGPRPPFELLAITDTELVEVPLEVVRALLDGIPDPTRSLVDQIELALHQCVEDRVAMTGSATTRVVRLLLESRKGDIPLAQMRRHLWAEVLGMRPETLSRELRELQAQGLIRASPERVKVLDVEGLSRLIED